MKWKYVEKHKVYVVEHGGMRISCYWEHKGTSVTAFATINTSTNPLVDFSWNIWTRSYTKLSSAKRGCARVLRRLLGDIVKVLTEGCDQEPI